MIRAHHRPAADSVWIEFAVQRIDPREAVVGFSQ